MEVINKLKELLLLPKKLKKRDLVDFFEQNRILERMEVFYNGKSTGQRVITSKLATEEDEPLIPRNLTQLGRMTSPKIRKMHREFIKDAGLNAKFAKMTRAKVNSHIRRNQYNEMLDMDGPMVDDQEEEKDEEASPPDAADVPSDEKMIEKLKHRWKKQYKSQNPR
jgi:hypothetical protein